MIPPPLLANESARLAALRALAILDTPPEERFDRITRLAKALFSVPIVLISLIDADRQWFKSRQGLSECETSRGVSFCGHALAAHDAFVVPDATQDERFADNPLVTGNPDIRFYAGQPLIAEGHAVGTLCLIDKQPRELDAEQLQVLKDLAGLVEEELNSVRLAEALAKLAEREQQLEHQNEELHALNQELEAQTEALMESESRFRLLADAAFEGIMIRDEQGVIQANRAFAALYGYEPDEVIGLPVSSFVPPEEAERVRHYVGSGYTGCFETVGLRKDGSRFDVEVLARALRYEGRDVRMTAMRDVTERKQLERMKDELVAVVSHDLKNPLGSLLMALELLTEDYEQELPQEVSEVLGLAVRSVRRLIRMTASILDEERLNSGKLQLHPAVCDTLKLFAEALGDMRGLAVASDVELRAEGAPLSIWADGDRVSQVLTNLVGNAIKFSPRGSEVRLEARQEGAVALVRVVDQGRGIPADKLKVIFERFAQVEASDATQKGGTGLGLPICKAIVEQHGGRIWAESTPGLGSAFCFTLPLAMVPELGR